MSSSSSDSKTTNDAETQAIIKCATEAFLEYRAKLSSLNKPELGLIDDLTVTWSARYVEDKKIGYMHVNMHTKTIPEPGDGSQRFHSFLVNSSISLENDKHPLTKTEVDVE